MITRIGMIRNTRIAPQITRNPMYQDLPSEPTYGGRFLSPLMEARTATTRQTKSNA